MKRRGRKGFTLIELLVVMVIILLLAALLLPAIADVRRRAVTVKCMANMKSIGQAMLAWQVATSYKPEMPTGPPAPAEAVTYFGGRPWDDKVHNYLYCWSDEADNLDGSDGPARGRKIVNLLYPTYLKVGEVFYCPSFNRKTKKDLTGSPLNESVTYDNSWNNGLPDWWGYEWVNPRWPVTTAWVTPRYTGIAQISEAPTPDVVMFCHYSLDHAGALRADASVQQGRKWMENDVPFGW